MTIIAAAAMVAEGLDPVAARAGRGAWIEIENGRIVARGTGTRPGAIAVDDAVFVPGFVDLQVNGVGAIDFAHADADGWRDAMRAQARTGVTGCCPTLVSAPLAAYDAPLSVAAELWATESDAGRRGHDPGAAVIGVHLEGPFLGGAPGAHVVEYLQPVDRVWIERTLERLPGLIRVVTLAPEADPGNAATAMLAAADVVVAIGHTTATYEQAVAAATAGARVVTHLFNGMGPFNHRQPGVIGAALDDARLTPSLIADLVHVHPVALRLAIGAKRSVVLVTDAVAVDAGTIGAVVMHERDGAARLADGTLAGSILTMDQAVRNVVGLGFPLERAVEMASTVPSEILGCADRGRLEPGSRADIVALDRETLAVRAVWVGGRAVGGI